MENQLKNEQSPYLKQHKDNPVYWLAWNKESLKKAKEEKKPIFLRLVMQVAIGVTLWPMRALKIMKQQK